MFMGTRQANNHTKRKREERRGTTDKRREKRDDRRQANNHTAGKGSLATLDPGGFFPTPAQPSGCRPDVCWSLRKKKTDERREKQEERRGALGE